MRKIKLFTLSLMAKCHGYAKQKQKTLMVAIVIVMWSNPAFTFFWVINAALEPCSNSQNLIFAIINTVFSIVVSLVGAYWKNIDTFAAFAVAFAINFLGIFIHVYKIVYMALFA